MLVAGQHDLHVKIGQLAEVLLFGPVEARPQRRDQIAEVVLDAARGGSHVGGTNQILAAQADEIVLVVVGKAEHLVRHDVADVDDQVPRLFHQHAVEHDRHRPVGQRRRVVSSTSGRKSRRRSRSRRANRGRESARSESSRTSAGFPPAYAARAGRASESRARRPRSANSWYSISVSRPAPECIRVISGGSSSTRFGLAQIRRRASATVCSISACRRSQEISSERSAIQGMVLVTGVLCLGDLCLSD